MLGRRFQLVTWLIRLQRTSLVFFVSFFGRMKGSGKLEKGRMKEREEDLKDEGKEK